MGHGKSESASSSWLWQTFNSMVARFGSVTITQPFHNAQTLLTRDRTITWLGAYDFVLRKGPFLSLRSSLGKELFKAGYFPSLTNASKIIADQYFFKPTGYYSTLLYKACEGFTVGMMESVISNPVDNFNAFYGSENLRIKKLQAKGDNVQMLGMWKFFRLHYPTPQLIYTDLFRKGLEMYFVKQTTILTMLYTLKAIVEDRLKKSKIDPKSNIGMSYTVSSTSFILATLCFPLEYINLRKKIFKTTAKTEQSALSILGDLFQSPKTAFRGSFEVFMKRFCGTFSKVYIVVLMDKLTEAAQSPKISSYQKAIDRINELEKNDTKDKGNAR
jgi:hypothetical protein